MIRLLHHKGTGDGHLRGRASIYRGLEWELAGNRSRCGASIEEPLDHGGTKSRQGLSGLFYVVRVHRIRPAHHMPTTNSLVSPS